VPEKSQVESHEHQDNPDISNQAFPESVSKEREIYAYYDGYHCHGATATCLLILVPSRYPDDPMAAATTLIAMLETPEGIANADAIAAVPGIDVLLIGSNDLCTALGIPGDRLD
jgi:hypothetical protein